jgi:hypothetical protein
MTHNLTVTVEDELWKRMKEHREIRWSVLDKLSKKGKLSEKEMEEFAIKLGKKINR